MIETRPSHAHATASFWWLGVSAVLLLGLSMIGIVLGFRSLLISTEAARGAVACCGTVFSKCLLSSSMLRATIPWIGMGILLYGLIRAMQNAWRTIRVNQRFLAELREEPPSYAPLLHRLAKEHDLLRWVRLTDLPGRCQAVTAGLLSPCIYVTHELCATLSYDELAAVLLHEEHHRQRHDPLRALVILFLQDLLFFLPISYVFGRIFFEAQEDAADDAVALQGGDRLALASALCRLAKFEIVQPSTGTFARITGQGRIERRVERLLSPDRQGFIRPGFGSFVGSVLIGALLMISLYLPALMEDSPFEFHGCGPEYCQGMECMK